VARGNSWDLLWGTLILGEGVVVAFMRFFFFSAGDRHTRRYAAFLFFSFLFSFESETSMMSPGTAMKHAVGRFYLYHKRRIPTAVA
jgi:hypothetical protein